jgi:hypothetical protein
MIAGRVPPAEESHQTAPCCQHQLNLVAVVRIEVIDEDGSDGRSDG